ncbi:lvsA, partial [Symbiodinium microadriaticum]
MFEVLYPQKGKKSNDSPEEFESVESSLYDGFSKLVPGMGGAAAYARQLREVTVEHDGEDARMADFSFWLTDHRAQCDALTTVIDYNTSPLMPHILSPAYSIREIISEKTRHDALNQEDVAHTFWSEEFSLQIDVHISRSRMWLVYGFADIAKGSVFWKQVWCSLQSSPVWGTKPVVRSDGAKEDGGISFSSTWDEEVASLTFTPLSVDNVEEVSAVPWRLDFAEGPEKMRIRLEQDYNEEMTGDHDEVDEKNGDVSEANAVAEEVVEEESYDMEEFFKRMSQNKFLRKVSASIDEQEGQFVDELTDMIDDQVLVEEEEEEVDSDRDECESGDDEDAEGERGGEIPDLKITPRTTNFTGDDADTEDPSRPTSSSSSKKRFSERIFSAARSLPGSVRAVVKGEDMTHQGDTAGAASQSSPNDDTPTSAKHYSTPIVRSEGPSDFGKQESRKGMILNELVRGVIGTSEWDVGYFVNISRVALLIITPSNLHIVDGIQMQRDGHAKRLEWTEIVTQFSEKSKVVLTAAEVVASVSDHQKKAPSATGSSLKRLKSSDWAIDSDDEVYTIFKRRYQLEHVAMEVTDVSGNISNLEYLMHLNAAAGRSLQDLTQYPVFPWVLADYESESLNLQNPASFRDLSRPMGALGEKRAMQYAERFRSMDEFYRDEVEGCPPPFFYGTHYSCAGYVLYYLMRMQPFARMAISLQGGQFDVRELIPEFYFLPEFLLNSNCFELGETQKGDVVDDVQMPPWAGGDAREFIRLHRQALESKYVSENLHNWIDLIFGSKQRGKAAEGAMNVFIPLTYEGEVKLDEITDPMLREEDMTALFAYGHSPSNPVL